MPTKLEIMLTRKKRKRVYLKKIQATTQTNTGVINVHCLNTPNIGDIYCAPHQYFDELKDKGVDIFDYKHEEAQVRDDFIKKISANSLIIGGGGLLNRNGFKLQMDAFEDLAKRGKKTVLWGVGHNNKFPKTYDKVTNYDVDIDTFGLVGTRDYSLSGEYVPCVSCMHTLFDVSYTVTQEFGVILHKDTVKRPEIVALFKDYPTTSNTTDLEALITFIGSSQKVVTDSYHAMYWSMLMG